MRRDMANKGAWIPYKRAMFSPAYMGDPEMGESAEAMAEKFNISREAQDAYALQSYAKALHAPSKAKQEILPILGDKSAFDELPRSISLQLLRRCPPRFRKGGVITAGNSCADADGAAMVMVVHEEVAKQLKIKKALEVIDTVSVGVDPNFLATAPIAIVERLKAKGLHTKALDIVELNEAFAVKALAFLQKSGINPHILNKRGGAIAIGHPYGASGAKLMVSAFYEMLIDHTLKQGLALLAAGGGIGTGVWFKSKHLV